MGDRLDQGVTVPDFTTDPEGWKRWHRERREAATERFLERQEAIGRPVPKRWSKKRLAAMKPAPGEIDAIEPEG